MENTLYGKKWDKENTSVPVNDPEKTNDCTNLNTTLTDLEDFVDSYYEIYVSNIYEKYSYCEENLDISQTSQTLLQMDTPLGQRSKLGFYVPFNSQGHIGTGPQNCHLWDSNPQR